MTKRNKKKERKNKIIFIFIGIVIFGILGTKVYFDFFKNNGGSIKNLDSIKLYGYNLSDRDTKIYKTYFKELSDVLNKDEINYEEYAKLISKLFIIDVFTLDNKLASTDIGGLDFLYKDLKENFKENMGATLYKNVESNINGKRKQKLPVVKDVTIEEIKETSYTYNKVKYDGYLVSAKWEYETDLEYQNSMNLTLIRDKDILYIVKGE